MKLKISDKIICIPPYISTTWDQISFMKTEEDTSGKFTLSLHLLNGTIVQIPRLESSLIDLAFAAHLKFYENLSAKQEELHAKSPGQWMQALMGLSSDQGSSFPIRFAVNGMPGNLENFEKAFQHDPSQAETPALPPEMVEKISTIAKILSNGDLSGMPKPESQCNCMHCQIARAIHGTADQNEQVPLDDSVSDEELRFRNWDIVQTAEKMYVVTNPLDAREQYSVYLGTPIGCTCGQSHCEHIKAVLSS